MKHILKKWDLEHMIWIINATFTNFWYYHPSYVFFFITWTIIHHCIQFQFSFGCTIFALQITLQKQEHPNNPSLSTLKPRIRVYVRNYHCYYSMHSGPEYVNRIVLYFLRFRVAEFLYQCSGCFKISGQDTIQLVHIRKASMVN